MTGLDKESGEPVLALSGAAGIASATPRSHTQYAGVNIDTVAGHNQQQYAQESILQTAGQDIGQFALKGDIRTIASQGRVVQQAQHGAFEITGEKTVTVTSTQKDVIVRAKKSILLALEDGTYLRLAGGKVVFGMSNEFIVKSAGKKFMGPSTMPIDLPQFERIDQAQQMKLHNTASKKMIAPARDYAIIKAIGKTISEKSGGNAISKLANAESFDIV